MLRRRAHHRLRFGSAATPRLPAAALLAAVAAAACDSPMADRPAVPGAARMPTAFAAELPACPADPSAGQPPAPPEIEEVARGLEVPWDIAFLPDGAIVVTERPGRIRIIRDGRLDPEPWATLDVWHAGESGLMGVETGDDGSLYVAATFDTGSDILRAILNRIRERLGRPPAHRYRTRILHLTRDALGNTTTSTLLDGIPAGLVHSGGALRRAPDGALWVGTGDTGIPDLARTGATLAGSLLRIPPRGGPPEIVATGFRNIQGIAFHPDGTPFVIDHGPTGMVAEDRRSGHDELDRVVTGGDYGWPIEAGRVPQPRYRPPHVQWTVAIAPAGLTLAPPGTAVNTAADPAGTGNATADSNLQPHALAFIAALRHQIFHLRLGPAPDYSPLCISPLLPDTFGRIRALRLAPAGWLYFTTSNRDGRGSPGPADDRLLRIRVR